MKASLKPIIEIEGQKYIRIPIKTRILKPGDSMSQIIKEFAGAQLEGNDIVVISESPLAITQNRAVPVSEIKIGFLANFLWRFVGKVNYGIGLRAATSMQCAIDECGSFRILFAAIVGGLSKKILRRKGDFYRLAGMQAALIDAASTSPVPPYTACVIKGPLNPSKECELIKSNLGINACVMDINDIGGSWMIGSSKGVSKELMEKIMKDNPQGQGDELTPICIVRKI